jgi:2-deoxy-D-gluconate 3-dehydrogenase
MLHSSSIGGLTVPAYAAAKHGVTGVIKALSNEWSSKGIDVNGIAPGYINTDMNTALLANPTRSRQILERIPAGRWGKPEDFEGVIVYLASRASDYTGRLSFYVRIWDIADPDVGLL